MQKCPGLEFARQAAQDKWPSAPIEFDLTESLALPLEALSGFTGTKRIYRKRQSETAYQEVGAWVIPSAVNAPSLTPPPGSYGGAQTITISSTTAGASIRYTTDGSVPSPATGTVYTGPVTLSATTTLRAIAYKTGMSESAVVSGTYTITGLPADLTVTNVPSGSTTFKATNSITAGAGVNVNSAAKATFEAGSVIHLLPGFQATAGGTGDTFQAKINPLVQ